MSSDDLLLQSIEFKLRWLAKELRWLNNHKGIEDWGESVTSLVELRSKVTRSTADSRRRFTERRYDQNTPAKKKFYTISPQTFINIEEKSSTAIKQAEKKRRREWESRHNWDWMNKDKVKSWATKIKEPAAVVRGLIDKQRFPKETSGLTQQNFKVNMKGVIDKEETWRESLDMEGDGSEQDEATKVHSETNNHQRELSLIEKKKNRDIWRNALLERLKKENVPVEHWRHHWGDAASMDFRWLIGECAPHGVRVAVIKDLGYNETGKFLFTELRKFYEKG